MSDGIDPVMVQCARHGHLASKGRFAEGAVLGDWRLTAFIGRGGSGEVYCAEHMWLGTPVAVKILTRDYERAKARFEREAKLGCSAKSGTKRRARFCRTADIPDFPDRH